MCVVCVYPFVVVLLYYVRELRLNSFVVVVVWIVAVVTLVGCSRGLNGKLLVLEPVGTSHIRLHVCMEETCLRGHVSTVCFLDGQQSTRFIHSLAWLNLFIEGLPLIVC